MGTEGEDRGEGDEELDTAACFMHNVIISLNCPSNSGQTKRLSGRKNRPTGSAVECSAASASVDKKL